jgi:uncharacterized OsmC-like protein
MGEAELARPRARAFWGPPPLVLARIREEHVIAAEPPRPLGGQGVPTPIEYTLGALAACIAALTRRVSKERGVSVKSLEVEVEAKVDLRELRGEVPRSERKGIHDIVVTVKAEAPGVGSDDVKAVVEEALSRCPIVNALRQVREISLRLEGA